MHSEPNLIPAVDVETLVVVTGTDFVFDEIQQPVTTTTFGDCDVTCVRGVADTIDDHAASGDLTRILSDICWNCEAEGFLSLLVVDDGQVRLVGRGDLLDVLAPIDTEFEALLVYGRTDLIRPVVDGWEVIRSGVSHCSPYDRTHTLASLTFEGEVIELASYVEPADPNEDEVCA